VCFFFFFFFTIIFFFFCFLVFFTELFTSCMIDRRVMEGSGRGRSAAFFASQSTLHGVLTFVFPPSLPWEIGCPFLQHNATSMLKRS
jgi:hypothetical protein